MKHKNSPSASISRDRQLVASEETWEVSYLSEKFGVSRKEIENAIRTVGHSRDKVEEFLKGIRKG